ncbi:DUF1802 family protein [Deinococcus maricopensis]|uniref:DUF1802 family protein n=1 Tax=Deinococcus maricopensis (strain DSM 21211 / LMG 22137 / NRRL B-23946 / LB-34) TaxID=709986 RepID=E8U406_DEIML|nr:DUF1802 family protein [Deinococcus maricopensis]ADV65700.1 protein of unknown function DUF1802 [Deinococcus maricopensis DSM 21211]
MALFALKEWDAQVQALGQGSVSVLVRKGGIMETHEGFEVEHREFLLYPTFLHQNPQEVRSPFQSLLRMDPQPGRIVLPALAEVVEVWKVEDAERALRVEPFQALNASAIERRFHYRNRPWLHVLLVRVRPLIKPLALEETPEMLGCVSWVPLEVKDVQAGPPVVPETALQVLRSELQALLTD